MSRRKKDIGYDQSELENLMKTIFPNMMNYPVSSVTHALYYYGPGRPVVSFMVVVEDEKLHMFTIDSTGGMESSIRIYTRENKYGIGRDLLIRFEYHLSAGTMIFETVLTGDDPPWQREFVRALKKVDNAMVWLVDKDKNLVKVFKTNWNYRDNKSILKAL